MDIQKIIKKDSDFRLLPGWIQDTITDRKKALDLIQGIAIAHKQDPTMEEYRSFEEQMGIAFWATRYWEGQRESLSLEQKKYFDYVVSIRPKA